MLLTFSRLLAARADMAGLNLSLGSVPEADPDATLRSRSRRSLQAQDVVPACNFDIGFLREGKSEPSGATFAGSNKLIVPDDGGDVMIVEDLSIGGTVVRDELFRPEYHSVFGQDAWPDLESAVVIHTNSTIVYLAIEPDARIIEYDYDAHVVLRAFELPSEVKNDILRNRGVESSIFVPATDSAEGGYFYIGSQHSGTIHIVEVPIKTGPNPTSPVVPIETKFITKFTPNVMNSDVAGLSYADGYMFLNYDDRDENTMVVYSVDPSTGLPDEAGTKFQGTTFPTCPGVTLSGNVPCVKGNVSDAEGLAVRRMNGETWEVFFVSDTYASLYGYYFDFENGFSEHPLCASMSNYYYNLNLLFLLYILF